MQSAHDTLKQLLDRLTGPQAVIDQIETLTRPYMTPVQGEEWLQYRLTTQEVRVACLLHTKLGKLVTRDGLLDAMWFDDPEGGKAPKNLDVVLCHVRHKTANAYTIENIHGRGYIMHRVIEAQAVQAAA